MRYSPTLTSLSLLATAVLGCAYYNGLYNANQLAKEAVKAEREGRRGEAQSLWAQAAVKAESVATRYPDSRYWDDALLLQGNALRRIGECRDAIAPLRQASATSADVALRAQAGLLLGECELRIGRADSAWTTLSALVEHSDSSVASRALLWRGRAAMARGEPFEALQDLRRTTVAEALFDRAIALAQVGQVRDAASTLDTARRLPFDEERWMPVLENVGAVDVRSASALVERLLSQNGLTSGQRARLLMADGVRWTPVDQAYAAVRFEAAASVAGDSLESRLARAHLTIAEIRRTADLGRVLELTDELGALMLEGGEVVNLTGPFAATVDRIGFAVGSPPPPHADLHIFRGAEEARDSLRARPLAARLFTLVAERYPASIIAPKALLAAAELDLEVADSLRRIVRAEYPHSAYTKAAAGEFSREYTAIEDSIHRLLASEIIRGRR